MRGACVLTSCHHFYFISIDVCLCGWVGGCTAIYLFIYLCGFIFVPGGATCAVRAYFMSCYLKCV